jgi:hypothetical protein
LEIFATVMGRIWHKAIVQRTRWSMALMGLTVVAAQVAYATVRNTCTQTITACGTRAVARPVVALWRRRCGRSSVLDTDGAQGVSQARRGGSGLTRTVAPRQRGGGTSARHGWTAAVASQWSVMATVCSDSFKEWRVLRGGGPAHR